MKRRYEKEEKERRKEKEKRKEKKKTFQTRGRNFITEIKRARFCISLYYCTKKINYILF